MDRTGKIGGGGEFALQATSWRSPVATDSTHGGPNSRDRTGAPMLTMQAAQWPTVGARDGDPRRAPTKPDSEAWRNKVARGAVNAAGLLSDDLSSSASAWPTPQAADHKTSENYPHKGGNPTLVGSAQKWTTPQAHDVTERGSGQKPTAAAGNACLARDARQWPTPNTPNTPNGGRTLPEEFVESKGQTPDGKRQVGLEMATKFWPTPTAKSEAQTAETPTAGQTGGTTLKGAAQHWPTPDAAAMNVGADPEKHRSRLERLKETHNNGNGAGMTLGMSAQIWPTPNARDHKGQDLETRTGGASLSHATETGVFSHSLPQDQTTPGGQQSLLSTHTSHQPSPPEVSVSGGTTRPDLSERKRLNPGFGNWLMGISWWWTHPELTSSARLEMELWQAAQLARLYCLLGEPESSNKEHSDG